MHATPFHCTSATRQKSLKASFMPGARIATGPYEAAGTSAPTPQ